MGWKWAFPLTWLIHSYARHMTQRSRTSDRIDLQRMYGRILTDDLEFAAFIPPGLYSRAHPRETHLHYLADITGATARRVKLVQGSRSWEIEIAFKSGTTGEETRLVLGGLDEAAIPTLSPDQYSRGWQGPMGIGNPSFFESYDELLSNPPQERAFYGFHLDAEDRWMDHHAIGVDGPVLHWDADDPSLLHLYLLSYERHALLNHLVLTVPREPRA